MRIGITGGIGSGKSYVCDIIASMGFPVYNCDAEAKRLMVTSPIITSSLRKIIGSNAYTEDCQLNKPVIAEYLFRNKNNGEKINAIVHPVVKDDFLQWATHYPDKHVFIESAILFESGFNTIVDRTIGIYAPRSIRIERAMKRDNATMEQIERRMHQQLDDDEYRLRCDFYITNDGISDIAPQIDAILKHF